MFHPEPHVRRFSVPAALAACLALLAACASEPPAPPPEASGPPLAPAPITLDAATLADAAAFETYIERTDRIDPAFRSGSDVASALRTGDSISASQLLRGEVAFAAVAALQDPNFVANLRAYAGDASVRRNLADRIVSDPRYAVAFTGSDTAAGLALAALKTAAGRMIARGGAVRQAAYDVQSQAWSRQPVLNRPERLSAAKASEYDEPPVDPGAVEALSLAATGRSPIPLRGDASPPPYPPVIVRGLAIAALAALGEGGPERREAIETMEGDDQAQTCLGTARLNLYQCLAVARPNYEDVFCLGQHLLIDSGKCLMISAGGPQTAAAPPSFARTAQRTAQASRLR